MDILTTLPDIPRWVEARGMLLTGRGTIIPPEAGDPVTMVKAADTSLAVVIRWDDAAALARAMRAVPPGFSVIAPAEAEAALAAAAPGRSCESATLFALTPDQARPERLPDLEADTRLLREDELRLLDRLPPVLRGELHHARSFSPIAVAFVDAQPVAFCYAGWETETLWDVSIDVLDGFRRRGLGWAACACLIRVYAILGKTSVWGARASNVASVTLAQKLGFEPVDQLIWVGRQS